MKFTDYNKFKLPSRIAIKYNLTYPSLKALWFQPPWIAIFGNAMSSRLEDKNAFHLLLKFLLGGQI